MDQLSPSPESESKPKFFSTTAGKVVIGVAAFFILMGFIGAMSPEPKDATTVSATSTPVNEQKTQEQTHEAIGFTEELSDDPNLPAGQFYVLREGVAGERTMTYELTSVNGKQTNRTLISNVVTKAAVNRVVARGTKVVQVAAAPGSSGGNCTPGYSPCLPPMSDYDCVGGSGNGPGFTGTVSVTGSDPYDLDRDRDGVGCE
jgi:hypothetical protein